MLSTYVLDETERNLGGSAPRALTALQRLLAALPYRLSTPDDALVAETAQVIVAKDAPIVAAARAADVELLASYDRRDLLSKAELITANYNVRVATPDEVLALIRSAS